MITLNVRLSIAYNLLYGFDQLVEKINGVGPETAKKLAVLGVVTIYDLLTFWPRRYDDYSEVLPIKDIEPGAVTVKAQIESITTKRVRRGMHLTGLV